LTARVTALFALIVCLVIGSLGAYLFTEANRALETRADLSLVGRVEHFRTLLHDLYNVQQLEARPDLFETMLGNEQDVIEFRKPGSPPFIRVNPAHVPVPALTPVPVGQQIRPATIYRGARVGGAEVHWVAAQARIGRSDEIVEIVAAHVMTHEGEFMRMYFRRVILTVLAAVLITALLGYAVLYRGLQPVRTMARKAAEISPANLSVRLQVTGAPPELQQLAASFNAMLERLALGFERLSQFAADLSHEIRTPIGVLIGQTQVTLAQARTVEQYQTVLESNLEELERLSRMAENILFLAHAEHAGLAVERSSLDLREELTTITDYFEGLADERQLGFTITASGHCHANAMLCRRAISNLVLNAVRYAQPGTVIALVAREDAGGATIRVENQGEPLGPTQLGRLFDRFYRGSDARSEFTESNGLGLAIVRAIMSLHAGTAEVSCTPRGRIRFTLAFPPAASRPVPQPRAGNSL
jgi:two-component system heavy metal sensor histidine kinase CusS